MKEGAGETQTETPAKKRPRGKPFAKGNPGGPGRGKRPPMDAAGAQVLADFEYVYSHPEAEDSTPGHQYARKLLRDNYEKFLATYVKLKGAGRGKGEEEEGRSEEGENAEADAGRQEEQIEVLIGQLLAELK